MKFNLKALIVWLVGFGIYVFGSIIANASSPDNIIKIVYAYLVLIALFTIILLTFLLTVFNVDLYEIIKNKIIKVKAK